MAESRAEGSFQPGQGIERTLLSLNSCCLLKYKWCRPPPAGQNPTPSQPQSRATGLGGKRRTSPKAFLGGIPRDLLVSMQSGAPQLRFRSTGKHCLFVTSTQEPSAQCGELRWLQQISHLKGSRILQVHPKKPISQILALLMVGSFPPQFSRTISRVYDTAVRFTSGINPHHGHLIIGLV